MEGPVEPAVPFDWHRMFIGDEPVLFYAEIAFRVVVIYAWALLLVRHMGKRGSRNLSPLETVVVIVLGSATGDAMFYPQVPITYAAVVVVLIVGLSRLVAELEVRSRPLNHFMDGQPLLMVREGRIVDGALPKARLRHDEFLGMLRQRGHRNVGEVQFALLERDGDLSVLPYPEGEAVQGESTWPSHLAVRDLDEPTAYARAAGSA
jgi:uncharacterized membrane protein YcaP (DUF421 family)